MFRFIEKAETQTHRQEDIRTYTYAHNNTHMAAGTSSQQHTTERQQHQIPKKGHTALYTATHAATYPATHAATHATTHQHERKR